jgi:phage tail protein X
MKRYKYAEILNDKKFKRFNGHVKYPEIPLDFSDIYVFSTQGDRFDILAQQYYSDSSLWWVISIANSALPQNSYYIPEGTQVRIPQDIGSIISKFRTLNER